MTEQLTLTFRKPRARSTDPETSWQAAADVKSHAQRDRDRVLAALRAAYPRALSDWEYGGAQTSLGVRRGELVKEGRVEWSGEFGRSPSGSSCRLWRYVPSIADTKAL